MNEARIFFCILRMTVFFSQLFLLRCLGTLTLAGFLHCVVDGLAATTVVHAIVAFLKSFPASV